MKQLFLVILSGVALIAPLAQASGEIPCEMRAALDRLNQYRKQSGLKQLVWDPKLAEMAQAHADYYSRNCTNSNLSSRGHFETPGAPGYSAEGDAAARASGLGLSATSPLDALEMLMSLPYHRTQLLDASVERVGGGYSGDKSACRIGLFMTGLPGVPPGPLTLPTGDSQPSGWNSAVVFPPNGMTGVPNEFNPGSETPDPRGFPHGALTGYPISIRFYHSYWINGVTGVRATLADSSGVSIPVYPSFPNQPAVAASSAPTSIYAGSDQTSGDNWIGKNHDSVFLLPQLPLKGGTHYTVTVDLLMSQGPPHRITWSFSTAPIGSDVLLNPNVASSAALRACGGELTSGITEVGPVPEAD